MTDTKGRTLPRPGAPTRRSADYKRATGGFLPQAGVRGKMGGGGCCQTAGKITPHGSLQSKNSQRSPPKLGKMASSRLLLSSTYWWVFGQDARRESPRRFLHFGTRFAQEGLPKLAEGCSTDLPPLVKRVPDSGQDLDTPLAQGATWVLGKTVPDSRKGKGG